MPKRTSPVEIAAPQRASRGAAHDAGRTEVNVVVVTLDSHLADTVARCEAELRQELPGLSLTLHSAAEWTESACALAACEKAIAEAHIVVVCMLFMDDHINGVRAMLEARRADCDAIVCCLSAPDVTSLTRLGSFDMQARSGGGLSWLKKLRGRGNASADDKTSAPASAGAKQMAMLRRLPQLLRLVPGAAQDLRTYLLVMRYWLLGSEQNIGNMVRFLIHRYAAGERSGLRSRVKPGMPVEYPDVGLYHPALPERITTDVSDLPSPAGRRTNGASKAVGRKPVRSKAVGNDSPGCVGLVIMRSYVLAGNTAHYDGVIAALELRGFQVLPVFASGLDARPAMEAYFEHDGRPTVDVVVSLTGFSLVGGPAYNDSKAAVALLERLDVPYLSAAALEFQSLHEWADSERGLLPLETMMTVAIPELDGATGTMVYGGRGHEASGDARRMCCDPERADALADRVARLVSLRKKPRAERRLAVVLFNFPPNSGSTGTAAFLSVFQSLYNLLERLAAEGYEVDVPDSVEALRDAVLNGNAAQLGAPANVHQRVAIDDYVRAEPYLEEIEDQWGAAPGRVLTDGASLFVLGAEFGNVLVGVQPPFGYEGDPMRLLFERGLAPNHAFAAFYRHLREQYSADAVLHFGTHGALEFMPGKQAGMSSTCWPERLIGDLPNLYLYAANNPSEGCIAKRRSNATVVTHMTPTLAQSGLYRELADLKELLDRFRALAPENGERQQLLPLLREQAAALELVAGDSCWLDPDALMPGLLEKLAEVETTLIPHGLHVLGEPHDATAQEALLRAAAHADGCHLPDAVVSGLTSGAPLDGLAARLAADSPAIEDPGSVLAGYRQLSERLAASDELGALIHALDGGYVSPAPGGDVICNADVLPTGRNIHGFDPSRIPSAFAVAEGARQADCLLRQCQDESGKLPASVAMVLWGTDNLKSEGVAIGQVLALIGARPRRDSYGRLAGAELIPLETLGRPRVDVVMTLSGIFRDLLPGQIRLLAEASLLAARADEPLAENPIRQHALAYQQAHGCAIEVAALRVFSNADGAYGANVNQLVDSGLWQESDELGELFSRRKCFAYDTAARPTQQQALLKDVLSDVELTFQNLDSVELGVTTVDHYFDSLGGITKAAELARGDTVPAYIGDHTQGRSVVRSLSDQVALEARTRLLNPKWYEEMLQHGHEGVHQLEAHVTNTMGWSATTGQVAPWVYDQLTRTFVLDDALRERIARLNPTASVKLANRLLEAHERNFWSPDENTLDALQRAGEALEDRMEGIQEGALA